MIVRITNVRTRLFAVPLPEVLADAKHGQHHHFELVTTTIRLASGAEVRVIPTPAAKAAGQLGP